MGKMLRWPFNSENANPTVDVLTLPVPAALGPRASGGSPGLERQRDQGSNCQHPLHHQKSKRAPEKQLLLLY